MRMLCLLLAFTGLLALSGCSKKGDDERAKSDEAAATPVQLARAEEKPIESVMTAEAVLYPLKQATVVPKISAPVQRFLVQRGDHVREGQLVAVLESRDLAAAAQESKQLYEQAQATYQNTSAATMPDDLTKAESDVQTAQETLDAAAAVYESRAKLSMQGIDRLASLHKDYQQLYEKGLKYNSELIVPTKTKETS